MQNASKKSSLRNKLIVSFFLIILILGISISLIIQTILKQELVTEGLGEIVINNIIKKFTTTSMGLIMAVSFLALLIGFFLSNYITQPIKKLTKIINEIIDTGRFDIQIDPNLAQSDDEIGQLAIAFNKLLAKLKESHEVLEEKVRERTAKLTETVKELAEKKEVILSVLEDTRKVRDTLEKEKSKDETILSSIGEGLVVTDYNMKVLRINNAGEKMLGWKQEELFGKEWFKFIKILDERGKEISLAQNPLGRALTTTTTTTTTSFVAKNGNIFPIVITASQIKIGPNLFGAVIVFRDITHEKEVDKAKTEFVSLASHQLRTPLSTINWYTEMLLTGDAGKLNNEQKKYLEEVYKGNQRMVSLVNALLNVSRLEMGTFIINPEPTDILALSRSVINELKPEIEQKKLEVIEQYDEKLPRISVDSNLMRIVFQNLLSNAIKYTPEKGKIILDIHLTENNVSNVKCQMSIIVKDTGYGIPKKQQYKIFTKLFRADNAREKDTDGTGLGLYITKSIIDHSDGKIWFESEENKGTTFYVLLPLIGTKKKQGTKALE